MIVTNKDELTKECTEVSIFEAQEIIDQLVKELLNSDSGIGLAANQIGIDARVCIIRIGGFSLDLVNPSIIKTFDLIEYRNEGCLSFPKKFIHTQRFNEVFVKDTLHPAGLIAVGIEAIAIQHEIDHLNGITMYDREIKIPEKNQKCWCGSERKYKRCHFKKFIR